MGNKRNNSQEIESAGVQWYHRKIVVRGLCVCAVVLFLCLLGIGCKALANYLYFNNEHFVFRRLEMVPTAHYNAEKTQKLLASFEGKAKCEIGVTRLTKVDLGAIRQELLKDTLLEEVAIQRKMPDALGLVLKERRPLAYASGNTKSRLRLIDRNGVLFPFTGMEFVPPDLPFITNISNLDKRKDGVSIDDSRLKNAIELILLVNGREPVKNAGYLISVVQLNTKYTDQFECYLKPMPDNKVFSKKEIIIFISSEPAKMRSGLEKLDAILLRKLQEKSTLNFADLTLEHNINTRN